MINEEYVKASEIQEYTYCKRAWWLHRHGRLALTEQMKAGMLAHEKMAQSVQGFNKKKIAAFIAFGSALLIVIIYLLLRVAFNI